MLFKKFFIYPLDIIASNANENKKNEKYKMYFKRN